MQAHWGVNLTRACPPGLETRVLATRDSSARLRRPRLADARVPIPLQFPTTAGYTKRDIPQNETGPILAVWVDFSSRLFRQDRTSPDLRRLLPALGFRPGACGLRSRPGPLLGLERQEPGWYTGVDVGALCAGQGVDSIFPVVAARTPSRTPGLYRAEAPDRTIFTSSSRRTFGHTRHSPVPGPRTGGICRRSPRRSA